MINISSVEEPLDLVKLSMNERVYVKCKGDREITGTLIIYDSHLNLLLRNVEEKITKSVFDDTTQTVVRQESTTTHQLLYLRGDLIILVSPVQGDS